MAKGSFKKLVKSNAIGLRKLRYGVGAFLGLHTILLFLYTDTYWGDLIGLLYFIVINTLLYVFVHTSCQPRYDELGEIADPGIDLHSKGMMEYTMDILFVHWFVEALAPFSRWFWLVLLLIPSFAIYKIASLYFGSPSMVPEQVVEKKNQKKMKIKRY